MHKAICAKEMTQKTHIVRTHTKSLARLPKGRVIRVGNEEQREFKKQTKE